MKLKKLWLGLAIALGVVLAGQQQTQAATNVVPEESTYFTNGQSVAIFSDPELQNNTGRTLDPNITAWKSFNYAVTDNGTVTAIDLGGGQWVQYSPDKSFKVIPTKNTGYLLEYFSAYRAIPVYSDPNLTHQIGSLDPNIADWAITKQGIIDQSDAVFSFDLGDNQWVGSTYYSAEIASKYFFGTGTTLYNQDGQPVATLNNPAHDTYKIFETRLINGQIAVRLGDNNQWAYYDSGTPY